MPGTLTVCATPIGNLQDASPRLANALRGCDVVYAEDTRRTQVLLDELGVAVPLRSYFAGNEEARAREAGERLAAGETVGIVTDAGMPGISDPGYSAVQAALAAGATVTVVPGPSAVTAALAVSGLPADRFVFEGFLPRKGAERRRRLDDLAGETRTAVLFAARDRVAGDLADLARALGGERSVAVARELTKAFEEVWRGSLAEAAAHWAKASPKGEFTLVVGGAAPSEPDLDAALAMVAARRADGTPFAEAVRQVAAETGTRRRRLYEAALRAGVAGAPAEPPPAG